MKLFHVTDEPDRILSSGFDDLDCFVGDAGVVMWERPESRGGDATIEIELPDNLAGSYAHRRTAAVWGRASFYLVPVDVANAHLVARKRHHEARSLPRLSKRSEVRSAGAG